MVYEARLPESPYLEAIWYGHTTGDGSTIRPAENHWHLVLVRHQGQLRAVVTGPWTAAGITSWGHDAEILWLKFKPGTFMPHLPVKTLLNRETTLPSASSRAFWLHGSAWPVPDFEDADTFVERLVRAELLVHDPAVSAALRDEPGSLSPRTLRHRFLHATGLSKASIRQIERAQRAEALLRQGVPIADTVYAAGYFDQPHLTRALKRLVGYTPAQLVKPPSSAAVAISYKTRRDELVYPGEEADIR